MPAFFDAFDNDRVVAGHVRHPLNTRFKPLRSFRRVA